MSDAAPATPGATLDSEVADRLDGMVKVTLISSRFNYPLIKCVPLDRNARCGKQVDDVSQWQVIFVALAGFGVVISERCTDTLKLLGKQNIPRVGGADQAIKTRLLGLGGGLLLLGNRAGFSAKAKLFEIRRDPT